MSDNASAVCDQHVRAANAPVIMMPDTVVHQGWLVNMPWQRDSHTGMLQRQVYADTEGTIITAVVLHTGIRGYYIGDQGAAASAVARHPGRGEPGDLIRGASVSSDEAPAMQRARRAWNRYHRLCSGSQTSPTVVSLDVN